MIWVADHTQQCTYLSPGWLEFTGRTQVQELGFGWLDGVYHDDRDQLADALTAAYRGVADPIIGHRLIVTPHAAWSSPESVTDARRLSVETAMLYLRDGKLRNLVNAPKHMR